MTTSLHGAQTADRPGTAPLDLAATATPAPETNPHHAKRWWILGVLAVAQLMVVLDATVVNIALPTAQKSLAFSDGDRQWVVTAYALAFGSLLLIGGRLADLFGRKAVLIVGLLGFAAASAVGGAATGFGMLVTARAVQGAFGALLAPACLSLLTTTFTEAKERARAFGIYGAIAGGGAAVGLLLGGLLTEYASWRWTLFVNLVFAALALAGAVPLLRQQRASTRPSIDLPGTLAVTAGLFAVVYGFSHAETAGWGNGVTVGFLVAAGVLLLTFVGLQLRVRNPLMPMHIVTDRNRGGAFLAMFAAAAGMFGVFLFLTYYLQQNLGYSAVRTGLAFLPMCAILVVVASTVTTVLSSRVTPRVLIPVGLLLAGVGLALLTSISATSTYAVNILPATLIIGVGLGTVFSSGMSIATLGVESEDAGVASALVNVMQQVGGSIGTALLNTLAASAAAGYVSSHALSAATPSLAAIHSYVVVFWISAGIFAGGAVLSALLLRSQIPATDQSSELIAVV